MKKSIFILAALFAATFANAQITLEKEFEDVNVYSPGYTGSTSYFFLIGDIFIAKEESVNVYDANSCELICSLDISGICGIARNLFSNDNSVIVLGYSYDEEATDPNQIHHVNLYRADGTVFQDLGYSSETPSAHVWQLNNGDYRLQLFTYYDGYYKRNQIYSLPGKGQATEISSPSSPKRSARKIANKGNVLVETENNTYTLTGQQVK